MKLKFCTALLTAATMVAPLSVMAEKAQDPAEAQGAAAAMYGKLPLSFEPTGSSARFLARSGSYAVSVGARESTVAVTDAKSRKQQTLHFAFEKANPAAPLKAMEPLPGETSYYIGKDASKWRLGVKSYGKLRAQNVYPGVDVIYYGDHRQLEFDFVVAPKADPGMIALSFSGMEKLSKDGRGDLVAQVGGQAVRFAKPYAYQTVGGASKPVEADYELAANGKVRLHLGDYDRNVELIVDPVVSYATYLGGSLGDVGNSIAVDSSGNAYVTGQTCSSDFPGSDGTFTPSCDAYVTKFNAKGTAILYTRIIGGTTPDNATASGNGIALDSADNVYIVGTTNFTDLPGIVPPTNGLNSYQGGDSDAFIVILAGGGTSPLSFGATAGALVRSTYLGGSGADAGYGIAVDTNQNVTVVGQTCSDNFPAYNAFETKIEFCVAFVTKLDNTFDIGIPPGYGASALSPLGNAGQGCVADPPGPPNYFFSEFYAGQPVGPYPTAVWLPNTYYAPGALIVDSNGNTQEMLTCNGETGGTEPGALLPSGKSMTAWATVRYATTSESLDGGTAVWENLGAYAIPVSETTEAYGVALDPVGDIFAAGGTTSPSLAPYSYYAGSGAWVLKVSGGIAGNDTTAGTFLYGTVLETNSTDKSASLDTARAIAVDTSGRAYVAGTATGSIFTTNTSYSPALVGSQDAFLVRMKTSGGSIDYGTYLGGAANNQGLGVATDTSGAAYVTGSTQSVNFPTINPLDDPNSQPVANAPILTLMGQQNAFISKFTSDGSALIFSTYLGGSGTDQGNAIATDTGNAGNMYIAGTTTSPDLEQLDPPTYGAPQKLYGGGVGDAFVAMVKGSSLPTVTVTPGALNFFPADVGLSSNQVAVKYLNTNANSTVSISSIAFGGPNAGDFMQVFPGTSPGDCAPGVVNASTYCNIWVVFTPSGPGYRQGTLTIVDDASSLPHIVSLNGTGEVPEDSFTPTSLTFPLPLTIGTASQALPVVLKDTGEGTLDITSTAITGTNSGDFTQTSTCLATLASGQKCNINVIFTPSASGIRTAYLTVTDNAPGSPHNIPLQGQGAQVKAPTVAPLILTYPSQSLNVTSAAQTVKVTNNDPVSSLVLSTPVTTGNFAVAQTGSCGTSLAPASSCTIGVTFTPTAAGSVTGTLSVYTNAASNPVVVQLNGIGGAAASGKIQLSPVTVPFGNQTVGATSPVQTVTLTNTGTASLSNAVAIVTGNTPAGNTDFTIASNNCPATLAANAHCSFTVSFSPSVAGAEAATMTVNGSASNSPQTVALSGSGTVPSGTIQLSPAKLAFGNQQQNTTSSAQTVTLTNISAASALTLANIQASGANPSDFNSSTTCFSPATLAPQQSCTVTVTFTPSVVGAESAILTVTGSGTNSPQMIALSGTGTNAPANTAPFSVTPQTTGVSVTQGGTATYNFAIAPLSGYNGTINFSCSGLPSSFECSISPNPLAMDGTNVKAVTVSVNTAGTTAKSRVGARSIFLALLPFSMMGMLLIGKRRGGLMASLLLTLCLLLGLASCGAGSSSTSNNGGTNQSSYQFAVVATSSTNPSQTQSIKLNLVVNPQ